MLEFDAVLPDDVTIETFTRFDVSSTFHDSTTGQSLIMLSSKPGYDTLAKKDRFDLTFGLKSSGNTDVKAFVEANNCKFTFLS